MEKDKTVKKVLERIKKPSDEQLNMIRKVGLTSAGLIMTILGASKFRSKGWMFSLLGGALAYMGLSGKNPMHAVNKGDNKPLMATAKISINRDRHSVYLFWRKLGNLAMFMDHIKEVKEVSKIRSKWTATLNGVELNWEAEITEDKKDEKISWRSLIISEVQNKGRVLFRDNPDLSGTEVFVEIDYASDAGRLSKAFASMYHPVFEKQIMNDLNECKKILESDKIPHFAENSI